MGRCKPPPRRGRAARAQRRRMPGVRGPPPPARSCAACPAVCAVLERGQNQVHHTHMTPVPFFEKRRVGHVGICSDLPVIYIVYAFAAAGALLRRLPRRLRGAGEIPEPGPSHPHDPQCPFLRSAEYWARRDLPVLYI